MGNDQSSPRHTNNNGTLTSKRRRESSAALFSTRPQQQQDNFCAPATPQHIGDANNGTDENGTRQSQQCHQQLLSQWELNCRDGASSNCSSSGRRRRSSCAVLQMQPAAGSGTVPSATDFEDGIIQQQQQAYPRDLSPCCPQSGTTRRTQCQSPQHRAQPSTALRQWETTQQQQQETQEEEEKRHDSVHLPLNSARSAEAALPLRILSPQCGRHHFLAPLASLSSTPSSVTARNNRNRRMSVAGDQQESLRRELARAAAADIGTSMSNGGTPQRRFSRATTSNCAANSASVLQVTRKMSELAAGIAAETTVHEQLKLSSYQLHILQQSWPRIRSSGVFANAFKDLAHRNVSAKEMFQKMSIVEGFSSGKCCDQKEHGRQLSELFDFALQNLNGPSRHVQDRCYRMGEQHFSVFGSSNEAQLWDDLGESISHALAKAESVRGKREAFRAWITLTNFLVESMRVGYTQQFKRRSLQRHSSSSQVVVQLATLDEYAPSAPMMTARHHRPHTPTVPLTTL